MAAKINVGVVGLGRLGRVYASSLAHSVPNARLVAVADIDANVATAFASEFGVPHWYQSHNDLLENKK